jgi:hypothetical protein
VNIITTYSPADQIDPAVALGVFPEPLPKIQTAEELKQTVGSAPPQIIRGLLHLGSKMTLNGTSKSNKSWSLLDLALSVATGQEWWGHRCEKMPAIYINFELHGWAVKERLNALQFARPECADTQGNLHFWNLRGKNTDITLLRPQLEAQLDRHGYGLVILDPAYKLLGDRDENSNSDIAGLMNEFERLAQRTGAAVAIAHHFAKGDSSAKAAIDRSSGAGVWSRDPDTIITLSPHEEENCFTVNTILRNLPQEPEFVLAWDYPLMRRAPDLNPEALRRPQSKNKVCSDKEFIESVLGADSLNYKSVIERAKSEFTMSEASANRYLTRLKAGGQIYHSGGLYWAIKQQIANN